MNLEEFKNLVKDIVVESAKLKNKHTNEKDAPVNYAAIFCQSNREYKDFFNLASKLGEIYKDTKTGLLFLINLDTESGRLKLLKIRKPDVTRKERGDSDFTVKDYIIFKEKYLSNPGFSLIRKEDFEMIELTDSRFDVRVYFSHPPLNEQFGL